jgi:hypothetical protein
MHGMITESDIKALRTTSSKSYRVILLTVFPFGIVVFFACGVVNFLLSARFAETAGVTMREVIGTCFSEPSASQQYSGMLLKAVGHFETGLMEVVAVAFYAGLMGIAWKQHRMNTRILKFIEDKRD